MNSKWNFRLAASLALTGLVLCGTGCGGLGASGSISPATFLLPGIGLHKGQPDSQRIPPQDVQDAVGQPASPQVAAFSTDLVQ